MVVCVTVLLFSLFLWLSLSFPLSSPVLFCQAEDDLVLLAAIPLAVLDSTLCWWISYVSPMLLVCVPLSLSLLIALFVLLPFVIPYIFSIHNA